MLRVGSSFFLDPTFNTSPKPHPQKELSCRHPYHTSNLRLETQFQVPILILSTSEIIQIDLKWLGTQNWKPCVHRPLNLVIIGDFEKILLRPFRSFLPRDGLHLTCEPWFTIDIVKRYICWEYKIRVGHWLIMGRVHYFWSFFSVCPLAEGDTKPFLFGGGSWVAISGTILCRIRVIRRQ